MFKMQISMYFTTFLMIVEVPKVAFYIPFVIEKKPSLAPEFGCEQNTHFIGNKEILSLIRILNFSYNINIKIRYQTFFVTLFNQAIQPVETCFLLNVVLYPLIDQKVLIHTVSQIFDILSTLHSETTTIWSSCGI